MSNRTLPWGIGIIIAGFIILLGKLGFFHMLAVRFWPLIILAAGIVLYVANRRGLLPSVSLLPGGTLVVCSLLFLFCAWFGWHWMNILWPVIPGAAGVGLYGFAAAERSNPLRMVALGIGGLSLFVLLILLATKVNVLLLALLLIVIGVILAARRPRNHKTFNNLRLK